jgi:hypothetical protein
VTSVYSVRYRCHMFLHSLPVTAVLLLLTVLQCAAEWVAHQCAAVRCRAL